MIQSFIRSNRASAILELAILLATIFPILYFTIYKTSYYYIYVTRVINSTKEIVEYLSNYSNDGWNNNNNITDNKDISYVLNNFDSQLLHQLQLDRAVYVGYIKGSALIVCNTIKNTYSNNSGVLPTGSPSLDANTLSVEGPVWIIVSAFSVLKVNRVSMVVRRPVKAISITTAGTKADCTG